jgi:tetratricopeptide (TPR) repeat protein
MRVSLVLKVCISVTLGWIAVGQQKLLSQGFEVEPQVTGAVKRGDDGLVISLCSNGLAKKMDARRRAALLTYRGNAYLHQDNYRRAMNDYNDALRLEPRIPMAYCGRGFIYSANDHNELAVKEYDAAIRLVPKYLAAYDDRGHAYRKIRQFSNAIADFNTAIRLDPTDPAAYVELATVYYLKGEIEKVAAHLQQASAKMRWSSTEDQGTMRLLGWFRATCPDARFRSCTEAVKWAKRSCELTNWKSYDSINGLAAAYAECGDFDRAVTFEQQALKVSQFSKKDRLQMEQQLSLFKEHKPYRDNFSEP